MAKILNEMDLGELLFELSKKGKVIAPVVSHEHSSVSRFAFKEYEKGDTLGINYGSTILPPKEFLLPPKDVLFEYKDGEARPQKPENQIIFGLSLEDLEGIFYLTKALSVPVSDTPYLKRIDNTTIIAVDRFSPPKNIPFDVYLMKITGDRYIAYAGSKTGQEIIKSRLFKNQDVKTPSVVKRKDDLIWDTKTWRSVEKSKNHPVWDELAQICFGCGICSFTCPMCYCFEEEDSYSIGKEEEGQRCRTWDSCMLASFAETTAGNFRPVLASRIYNWYYHKFVRMPREYGFPGCIACNRCTIYCPAKINYRAILTRVRKDFLEKGEK